jgi:hypothetical protein
VPVNDEMKKEIKAAVAINNFYTNPNNFSSRRMKVTGKETANFDIDIDLDVCFIIPKVITILGSNKLYITNELNKILATPIPMIDLYEPIQFESSDIKEVVSVESGKPTTIAYSQEAELEAIEAIYNNLITTESLKARHQEIIDGLTSITSLIQNDKINPLDSDDKIEKYEALNGTYLNTDANIYSTQSREVRNDVATHIYREASWVLEQQINGYKIKLSGLTEDSLEYKATKDIIEILESKLAYDKEASTSVTIHIVNSQFDNIKGKGME